MLGLANKKTVTIQPAGKDQSVILATTKTRKQNKPASLLHKSVMKKEFRRMAKAVQNQVIWERIKSVNLCFLRCYPCFVSMTWSKWRMVLDSWLYTYLIFFFFLFCVLASFIFGIDWEKMLMVCIAYMYVLKQFVLG